MSYKRAVDQPDTRMFSHWVIACFQPEREKHKILSTVEPEPLKKPSDRSLIYFSLISGSLLTKVLDRFLRKSKVGASAILCLRRAAPLLILSSLISNIAVLRLSQIVSFLSIAQHCPFRCRIWELESRLLSRRISPSVCWFHLCVPFAV